MSQLRIGVIGAGAMGASHIATLDAWVAAAKVTAVFDADLDRAAHVAAGVGAVAASSAEAVVTADDVDALVIAAPDHLHEELALTCLKAGKPTLCEKPLATSVEGSQRIVDAEVAIGRRLLQVGFMRRFDPAFVQLRDHVASGALGAVRVVHCVHRNAQAHPTATSEGIVVNSMIHELDHLPWLLDDRLAAITVSTPRAADGALRDPQIAVIETAGGVLATAEVFVNARYGYDVQCEVVGELGTARLTPPYGLSVRSAGADGTLVSDDFVARFADAYRIELAAWVASARSGVAAGPSAWDGHRANLVAAAGVASLTHGGRVVIDDPAQPDLYKDPHAPTSR